AMNAANDLMCAARLNSKTTELRGVASVKLPAEQQRKRLKSWLTSPATPLEEKQIYYMLLVQYRGSAPHRAKCDPLKKADAPEFFGWLGALVDESILRSRGQAEHDEFLPRSRLSKRELKKRRRELEPEYQ